MSTVRIPPVLRANVGGAKQVEIPGSTVGEVIDGLVAAWPALRGQLLTEEGGLNRFVNVYLNDQDVRYLDERATPVGERDTIIILPAMAGGADPGGAMRSSWWSDRPPARVIRLQNGTIRVRSTRAVLDSDHELDQRAGGEATASVEPGP
jgi:molybdopterin converting factor small subunit